jgi:HSP20 family protein
MYFLKVRYQKGAVGRQRKGMLGFMEYKGPFYIAEDEAWLPEADFYETAESYVLKVNVAGVKKQELDLTLYGDSLKVSGKRVLEEPEGVMEYHRLEMRQGYFERRFKVPPDADPNTVEAVLADGILTVKIRKKGQAIIDVVP